MNATPSINDGQFDEEGELEASLGLGLGSIGSMSEIERQAAERKAQEEAAHADTLRSFGGIAFEATNADPYYDVELKGTQEALGPFSPTEQSATPVAHDTDHPVAS